MLQADDGAAATPSSKLDAEGTQLQLDAEKAKLRAAIAASQQSAADTDATALRRLLPTVTDTPKGQVTLGDKSGALGPWRGHQVLDAIARAIAVAVCDRLPDPAARVLVVQDRTLLAAHWTATQVCDTLDRARRQLSDTATQIADADRALTVALDAYDKDASSDRPGQRQTGTEYTSAKPTTAMPSAGGAFGAAVELLGLLRTDYTVTATQITVTESELMTLVASHLTTATQPAPRAEADGFATAHDSPTATTLKAALDARDSVARALSKLQVRLAPANAELADLRARGARLDEAWAAAVTDGKDRTAIDELCEAADGTLRRITALERASGPARAFAVQALQLVTAVDATFTALAAIPPGGEAPLLTAVRRERLDQTVAARRITHVLYASLDTLAAEAVTRRSILGASGLLRFLSAGSASWLLLDVATGDLAGGGQVNLADIMTFSLERGDLHFTPAIAKLQPASAKAPDPLTALEQWAKVGVLLVIIALVLLGGAAFWAFVLRASR